VTVIGDGKETPVTVAGSKLTNKDELVQIGKDLKMPVSVKDTRKQLGEHVFRCGIDSFKIEKIL
jgi:hypothetical protein